MMKKVEELKMHEKGHWFFRGTNCIINRQN